MDKLTFDEWIKQLESIMQTWDEKHGTLPYDLPLASSTGLDSWRDYYHDDFTPQGAFDEDKACWF